MQAKKAVTMVATDLHAIENAPRAAGLFATVGEVIFSTRDPAPYRQISRRMNLPSMSYVAHKLTHHSYVVMAASPVLAGRGSAAKAGTIIATEHAGEASTAGVRSQQDPPRLTIVSCSGEQERRCRAPARLVMFAVAVYTACWLVLCVVRTLVATNVTI